LKVMRFNVHGMDLDLTLELAKSSETTSNEIRTDI